VMRSAVPAASALVGVAMVPCLRRGDAVHLMHGVGAAVGGRLRVWHMLSWAASLGAVMRHRELGGRGAARRADLKDVQGMLNTCIRTRVCVY